MKKIGKERKDCEIFHKDREIAYAVLESVANETNGAFTLVGVGTLVGSSSISALDVPGDNGLGGSAANGPNASSVPGGIDTSPLVFNLPFGGRNSGGSETDGSFIIVSHGAEKSSAFV